MNLTYELLGDDLSTCYDIASKLSQLHNNPLKQVLIGILGELAAIKFINYQLWKSERLTLNTNYKNGGDGGYDFIIGKDKWDVKTLGKWSNFDVKKFTTGANVLLFTKHLGNYNFSMLGFMPASRLQEYNEKELLPISKIPLIYPDCFIPNPYGQRIKERKTTESMKVGNAIKNLITKIMLNYEK